MNINVDKDLLPEIVNTDTKVQATGKIISASYVNSGSGKYIVDVDEIKSDNKVYNDKCRVCVYGEKGLLHRRCYRGYRKIKNSGNKEKSF